MDNVRKGREWYRSQTSWVEVVTMDGGGEAIRKTRIGSKAMFFLEINIHITLFRLAASYFPELLSFSASSQSSLFRLCSFYSSADQISFRSYRILPTTPQAAVRFTCDLLRILLCMHKQNIVHGDLHPRHILIDRENRLKISGLRHAVVCRNQTELQRASRKDVEMAGRALVAILLVDADAQVEAKDIPRVMQQYPVQLRETISMMLSQSSKAVLIPDLLRVLTRTQFQEWTLNLNEYSETHAGDLTALLFPPTNSTIQSAPWPISRSRFDPESILLHQFAIEQILSDLCIVTTTIPFSESTVKSILQDLSTYHQPTETRYAVTVSFASASRCAKCLSMFSSEDLARLDCLHCFCKECFNAALQTNPSTAYSDIGCWTCSQPFSPLSDAYRSVLRPETAVMLTGLMRKEEVVPCPRCKIEVDVKRSEEPIALKCPDCCFEFCSYCYKKKHYLKCSKYAEDGKLRKRRSEK